MSLPERELQIGEMQLLDMERHMWNERFVRAGMRVNGRTEPVSVKYRGGHTRNYPKRSFEVVRGGHPFHYNAEFDDPSLIRNALSFRFFEKLGVPCPRTKHVLLNVNGEPQGVYLELEGVDRRFFRRRGIGCSSLFYAVNNAADFGLLHPETHRFKDSLLEGYEHRFGGASERERLASFIQGVNETSGSASARFLHLHLDVDNYLRWLAGAVLTGNNDGFEQNYALYRHRGTGRFRITPWDYEGTWGRNCYGERVSSGQVAVTGYNILTAKVLAVPRYRRLYRELLASALRGPFTERAVMPEAEKLLAKLSPYVRQDRARPWSYDEFRRETAVIRQYIRERRALIAGELRQL